LVHKDHGPMVHSDEGYWGTGLHDHPQDIALLHTSGFKGS